MATIPGTFDEAATVAELLIDKFEELLVLFTALSPSYDAAYVIALRAERTAAQIMPDLYSRRAATQIKRAAALASLGIMKGQFVQLQGYIKVAHPTTFEIQWTLAGWTHYKKIHKNNFDSCIQMGVVMAVYIPANSVILLANNNMLPAYPADFLLKKTSNETAHSDYMTFRQATKVATKAKKDAFIALFKKLGIVCNYAKLLGLDENTLNEFNIQHLLQMVRGTRPSGTKGQAILFPSGAPAAYATLKFANGDIVHCDKNGKFKAELAEGDHYGTIFPPIASPYLPQPFLFPVNKGTFSSVILQLIQ